MSLFESASLVITPNGYKEDKLYSIKPTDGSGDLSVTRATTATRVNSSGLIESVSANVPRLDYSNGSCPSILVEPQRTNLITYSEQFDDASWDKSNGTITANATISPDGTANAEQWAGNGTDTSHDFYQAFTGGSNTTSSIYVKKNTAQFVYISLNYQSTGTDWATGVYDLDNLTTATFQSGGVTSPIASIKDVGNGWRRITLSVSTSNTSLFCMYGISNSLNPSFTFGRGRVVFVTSASFYAWGAQLEAGSYATSYIPTVASAVTRNADVISKTGISSLIGQTEGTIFLDFNSVKKQSGNSDLFVILNSSNSSLGAYVIFMDNNGNLGLFSLPSSFFSILSSTDYSNNRLKIALAYNATTLTIYVNGSQLLNTTIAGAANMSALYLGSNNVPANFINGNINTTALWKTKLTNTQLAELTTI